MIELKPEYKGSVFKMYAHTGIRRVLGRWAPPLHHSNAIPYQSAVRRTWTTSTAGRAIAQASKVPPPRVPIRRAEGAGRRS